MSASDIIQLAISALGIIITIGIILGANKKLEGSIEERLKTGDEKFKSMDLLCKAHGQMLRDLEVDLKVNDKQQTINTSDIHEVKGHVDCIEGRVTILENKN